jgi:hypothetical protein
MTDDQLRHLLIHLRIIIVLLGAHRRHLARVRLAIPLLAVRLAASLSLPTTSCGWTPLRGQRRYEGSTSRHLRCLAGFSTGRTPCGSRRRFRHHSYGPRSDRIESGKPWAACSTRTGTGGCGAPDGAPGRHRSFEPSIVSVRCMTADHRTASDGKTAQGGESANPRRVLDCGGCPPRLRAPPRGSWAGPKPGEQP